MGTWETSLVRSRMDTSNVPPPRSKTSTLPRQSSFDSFPFITKKISIDSSRKMPDESLGGLDQTNSRLKYELHQ